MRNKFAVVLVVFLLLPILSACNLMTPLPLPHSMKGYELYSWHEHGEWHFTLITGTNRNKTLEEIVNGETKEGEDGWVNIHVTGVDDVKALLSRVPSGEWVSWSDGAMLTDAEQAIDKLVMPPEEIGSEIARHAEQCGLDFHVSVP
jgi:predicted small lipoprotein YifL